MSAFRFGLAVRLRRYWPAGLVIGVAAGFVALTMLASSVGRESLLGPANERPPDLLVEPTHPEQPGRPLAAAEIDAWPTGTEVAWVDSSVSGWAEFQLDPDDAEIRFYWRLVTDEPVPERRLWQLDDGRLPAGADEIAFDQFQLQAHGLKLGDWLLVADKTTGDWRRLEIVGQLESRAGLGAGDLVVGLNPAVVDPATARQLLGLEPGQTFAATIKLAPGADREAVSARLAAGLGDNYQLTPVDGQDLEIVVGLTAMVGVFVALAILVAVFVIVNLFRIILASQIRDLASLRLLGATRAQVFARLLAESALLAVLVGLVSATLAWGAVELARPLINRHWDWQLLGPSLSVWYWLTPTLIGLGATLAGAVLPALAASRRRPVAALGQAVETTIPKLTWLRIIFGAVLVGLALLGLLLLPRLESLPSGLGGGLTFVAGLGLLFGLALVSAGLARPFGRLLGWLGRPLAGVVWRLGAGNIGRQPVRSAAVANSLLIGVSLITTVTILASSFQATSQQLLDRYFPSDWLIAEKFEDNLLAGLSEPTYDQEQIDPALADQLLAAGLLEAPSVVRFGQDVGRISWPGTDEPRSIDVGGFDSETIDRNFNYNFDPEMVGPALAAGQVLIDQQLVGWGLAAGQTLTVDYPASGYRADYTIAGSFANGDYDLILSNQAYLAAVGRPGVTFIAGDSASGLTPDEARTGLEQLLAADDSLAVYDLRTDFGALMDRVINIALNILRALLGLSLLVAVLGIFSTLSLSIRERRRELGTLRAIGLTRTRTVGLIVFEGLAMASFGASLGLLAGWLGGFVIIELLQADPSLADFLRLSLPFKVLAVYGLAAAALGALAALVPALLAARRPVVDCLADD